MFLFEVCFWCLICVVKEGECVYVGGGVFCINCEEFFEGVVLCEFEYFVCY